MAFKRRSSIPVIDYKPEEKTNWFENMGEAKPKKPLPAPKVITSDLSDEDTRRAGVLFQEDAIVTLNVADTLNAVRTPFNPGYATEMRTRARIKNRATGITAKCMDCQGWSRKRVTECTTTECPLWAFRFGSDPFRGKRGK